MNKFTQEDLVQYLYKETSEQKTAAIGAALDTDWNLRNSFEQLSSGLQDLEKVNLSPRNEIIDKILQHITNTQGQFSH